MLSSSFSRTRSRTDASTLPATMMVVAVLLALLSAAAYLTSQDSRFTARQQSKSDALTAADAALEYAYSQWKVSVSSTIRGNKTNIPPASTWSSSTLLTKFKAAYSDSGAFAANTGVTVTALNISATDQNGQPIIDSTTRNDVSSTATPAGVDTNNVPGYPGWSGKSYNYVASVTVSNPNHFGSSSNDGPVTVKRYFQVTTVPLFQAAIFYENNLEIHPGAKMVVTGLVHSNAKIFALGYNAQLQFMSNVSYVSSYKEGSNPDVTLGWDGSNTKASNTPELANKSTIDSYNKYGYNLPANYFSDLWADNKNSDTSATRASQLNQVSTIDPFGGASKNNNGLHDIVEVPADTNKSDQIAYNNASLRITIDSSIATTEAARYVITDGKNNPLPDADRANVIAALTATAPTNAPRATPFTDQRETFAVTVTSLDMAKLAVATVPAATLTATKEFGTIPTLSGTNLDGTDMATGTTFQKNFQGTVYIRDVAKTTSSTRTAIRLVNGRKLGQDVSIASDNGLYIQGDYNTGGSQASDVPSNGNDPTKPQATGYNRHSSAVMADAVTILSNNWSDGNSSNKDLNSRMATATTVNTAILAGDVPSNADPDKDGKGNGIASWRTGTTSILPITARWWRRSTARSSPGAGRPTAFTTGPTASGTSTRCSCKNSRPACHRASNSRAGATSARSTEQPDPQVPPMRTSSLLLPALVLFASVSTLSANIDFTLGTKYFGEGAPDPVNRFITDGNNRIYLRIPRGWSATSTAAMLTFVPEQPSTVVQVSQVAGVQALPMDADGLTALRKAAQKAVPEGAKAITPAGETSDLLPVMGWTSFEVTYDYEFFGQSMRRSLLYVNMLPGRVIQVSVNSTATDFDKVHGKMRNMIYGWFEPNRSLSPAEAKEYEEGGYRGS